MVRSIKRPNRIDGLSQRDVVDHLPAPSNTGRRQLLPRPRFPLFPGKLMGEARLRRSQVQAGFGGPGEREDRVRGRQDNHANFAGCSGALGRAIARSHRESTTAVAPWRVSARHLVCSSPLAGCLCSREGSGPAARTRRPRCRSSGSSVGRRIRESDQQDNSGFRRNEPNSGRRVGPRRNTPRICRKSSESLAGVCSIETGGAASMLAARWNSLAWR